MSNTYRLSLAIAIVVMTVMLQFPQEALAAPPGQPERVEVGQEAPLFELDSLDGEPVSLASLRGESPLILIFFRGTW